MATFIVVEIHVFVAEPHTELANLRHQYRIFSIRTDALLFQRAIGRRYIVLRIHIVILTVCIDILCAEVKRTAKQWIGHCQFRSQHTVSHPVFSIKCTVVLNLASFCNPALFIEATMQIVKVPVDIQFPHLTYIIGIQFMLRFPLSLLLGQVFPLVVEHSVGRYIARQRGCLVLISRERIFVFSTQRMVLIQHIVEARLDAIVTADDIRPHIISLLPERICLHFLS